MEFFNIKEKNCLKDPALKNLNQDQLSTLNHSPTKLLFNQFQMLSDKQYKNTGETPFPDLGSLIIT